MVDIFKALAEENRLRILSLLIADDLCVCEIESVLNMSQSNVSKHLTTLKQSGILRCYKKAQWAYYGISDRFIQENKELYQYLIMQLKGLPSYQDDNSKLIKCKQEDICNNCKRPN